MPPFTPATAPNCICRAPSMQNSTQTPKKALARPFSPMAQYPAPGTSHCRSSGFQAAFRAFCLRRGMGSFRTDGSSVIRPDYLSRSRRARSSARRWAALLDVADPAPEEGDLEVLVDVDFLGAQVHGVPG